MTCQIETTAPVKIISDEEHLLRLETTGTVSHGLRLQQSGTGTGSISIHVLDGGGDAHIGFGVDDAEGVSIGHSWHMGVDNSREDDFVLSAGDGLGSGDKLYIDRSTGGIGFGMVPPTSGSTAGLCGVWTTSTWNTMMLTGSIADDTTKNFRYCINHYDVQEEFVLGMMLSSNASANSVYLGGGTSAFNAATQILIYAAANQTTTTGTLIATFNTNGLTLGDGLNLITGTTTGMKIGTSASQKVGFFNATPIVQPVVAADADVATLITALTNLGLIRNS